MTNTLVRKFSLLDQRFRRRHVWREGTGDPATHTHVPLTLYGHYKPHSNGPLYSNTVIGTLAVDYSSRMRFMSHNRSATKQSLHLQSVAEISRHSVLSGDRIDNVRHRLGLATHNTHTHTHTHTHDLLANTGTQIRVCNSPFPSAGTAVSLFRAKTVQQRPLLPREVETWLPDCGVTH